MSVYFQKGKVLFRGNTSSAEVAFDSECCCKSCQSEMGGATIITLEFDEPTGAGSCDAYTLLRTSGVNNGWDPEPGYCTFWNQDPPPNSEVTCTILNPPNDPIYFYLDRALDANFGTVSGACTGTPLTPYRIEFNTYISCYAECTYNGTTYCRQCGKNVTGGVCLSEEDFQDFIDSKEITLTGCVWSVTTPDEECTYGVTETTSGTCDVTIRYE